VRKQVVASVVITLVAAGCGDAGRDRLKPSEGDALQVFQSPAAPFDQVAAGPVRGLIPDRWQPLPTSEEGGNEGFFASPSPRGWQRMDGSVAGMAATWIDVTRVGVPSDYYYLAASGPVLRQLTDSGRCRAHAHQVFANHRPAFFEGPRNSPGDYVATASGTCKTGARSTRWAYFVAAPGYGPVRKVGIPSSGLYVVVAVLPDTSRASQTLNTLLGAARFGGAGVSDLIAAARQPARAA
jgi:hypothetical protein